MKEERIPCVFQRSHTNGLLFFFLYGYLKDVYATKPAPVDDLNKETQRQRLAVPNELLCNLLKRIGPRYQRLENVGLMQFEHLRARRNDETRLGEGGGGVSFPDFSLNSFNVV